MWVRNRQSGGSTSTTNSAAALLSDGSTTPTSSRDCSNTSFKEGSRSVSKCGTGADGGFTNACYSDEASAISQLYIECQRRPSYAFTAAEADELRENYMKIMKRTSWKEELVAVAETLINESSCGLEQNVDEEGSTAGDNVFLKVIYGDQGYIINTRYSPVTCIGRHSECDIVLKSERPPWNCSRLHAVVYVIPNRNECIVADVGSFHGIKTRWRSGQSPCQTSRRGQRHLLVFQLEEQFSLILGTEGISLASKRLAPTSSSNLDEKETVSEYPHLTTSPESLFNEDAWPNDAWIPRNLISCKLEPKVTLISENIIHVPQDRSRRPLWTEEDRSPERNCLEWMRDALKMFN